MRSTECKAVVIIKIFKSGDRYPQQFELDPRYRHTFWALAIGNSTGGTLASYVCQQYKVQRYLSCKSLKEAQKSTFLAAIGIVFISLLGLIQNVVQNSSDNNWPLNGLMRIWKILLSSKALMIGNCCYAYFQYCDPWKNEWISERDQGTSSPTWFLFYSMNHTVWLSLYVS